MDTELLVYRTLKDVVRSTPIVRPSKKHRLPPRPLLNMGTHAIVIPRKASFSSFQTELDRLDALTRPIHDNKAQETDKKRSYR